MQKLLNQLPDLVIVDWMLQGMSRAILAKSVRGEALTNAISLLTLTALSEEPNVLKSFGWGIED